MFGYKKCGVGTRIFLCQNSDRMRKIPVTMATQHPDNARPSSISGKRFISAADEIEECFWCFSELGVDEYMWDWEGKFVDEAVIDRLYQNYHDYFRKNQLGRDKFLTFRVPNIWEEPSHRLPRAFMNLIAAEHAAKRFKFNSPPLFEVILPMTTRADQLIYLQKRFGEIAHATEEIFDHSSEMRHIEVIPLFEQIETMFSSTEILAEYVDFLKDDLGITPRNLRVFLARSDPAMNAGLVPTMLAIKYAISSYHAFGAERGIEMHPWIGGGSLPFRGGVNPENAEWVVREYGGIASLTIQSAFRYDYPFKEVQAAIKFFNQALPKNRKKFRKVSPEEGVAIQEYALQAQNFFRETVEQIAPLINKIAASIPSHRERVQHIGIFGYARKVGNVKLPRAIKFTGALYSLGVPPELIGTGRALRLAEKMGISDLVRELYVNIVRDLSHAGHYLNRENLDLLCRQHDAWKEVRSEIELIEKFIGEEIGSCQPHHLLHRNFTSNIFQRLELGQDIAEDVLRAAEVRKSLG